MRVNAALFVALAMALSSPVGLLGQSAQTTPSVSVPRLVNVTGVYQPANGQPPPPGTVVTLLVYADQQGGTPLWQETQNVEFDASGHFTLLLEPRWPTGSRPKCLRRGMRSGWRCILPARAK